MDPTVRPAKLNDAREAAEVHVDTWREAYRGLIPEQVLARLQVEAKEEFFRRTVESPIIEGQQTWVAVRDGRVAGFVSFGPSREHPDARREGEIYALYVRPEFWGRGLGRELFARACELLQTDGFSEAVLWVLDTNERARRFYHRAGWAADGGEKAEAHDGHEVRELRYRCAL